MAAGARREATVVVSVQPPPNSSPPLRGDLVTRPHRHPRHRLTRAEARAAAVFALQIAAAVATVAGRPVLGVVLGVARRVVGRQTSGDNA